MRPLLLALLSSFIIPHASFAATSPNIVIIFMDDMGYADVGCFGAQGYQTPNIDKLAAEGRKFTNFHVAQPVCSASRTALLTGCYPNRVGIHGALGPSAKHGINADEMTIAELVKQKGYATAAVGKWHLGSLPQFLPVKHGFDEYYGIPYSNDMWPYHPQAKKGAYPKLPMVENDRIVDEEITPEDQTHLTTDYTERGVRFIQKNKDKPFFLYLAHSMVHVPLFVSDKFKGKSGKGLFGDVMMEVDWSVGRIIDTLKENGLEDNTWVIFTSDNGPWLSYGEHAGSAGPLREGKGTCWEGGTRVAGLMKWPGKIPAGTTTDTMMMTIDLLPTIAHVIDAKLPEHTIDGLNCWPVVSGEPGAKNPHDFYAFYYEQNQLQAITSGDGRWKLQLPHSFRSLPTDLPKATGGKPVNYKPVKIVQPELYDLYTDISESKNLAAGNPDEVARLQKFADTIRAELGDSLMKLPKGAGSREAGK
ncbi:sulfatase [Prosthecobacter sp.]|uniref:sulfatase family protein n=1 Tax=Prosthecobacter sp. TaxID=1965333 RepID=UPI002ABAD5AF|nr:sulfatase [Prosthecobacter sp.]MDZ4404041.1 sulfatase [Prosthecobacter sp.]